MWPQAAETHSKGFVLFQAAAKPAPEPKAPAPPVEAVQLPEGVAFLEALTAAVPEDQIVAEKALLTMVNKLLRKDRENLFRTEPQKTNLHSRVVCPRLFMSREQCPQAAVSAGAGDPRQLTVIFPLLLCCL